MTIQEEFDKRLADLLLWRAQKVMELRATMTVRDVAAAEGVTASTVINWLVRSCGARADVRRERRISNGAAALQREVNKRDAKAQLSYGCSWAEVQSITGLVSWRGSRGHPLLKMYWHHKTTAQRVKMPWAISLPQYAYIVGPHVAEIGLRKGAKVFARIKKDLPWTIDNVHVTTLSANSYDTNGFSHARARSEAQTMRRAEKAAALQAEGCTLDEIAQRMRKSKAQVNNYLYMVRSGALVASG